MRTTDPDPRPFQPLGQRVTPAAPRTVDPRQIAPGILQDADGRLSTNLPLPKDKP
jgi:hypothetical protein